ncbi:glycosyltransferase [Cohnella zeiphila]|uniref:Glycosyltransferase n=1 Tax=Cohnella zeiphila TaxID=2761120 RepID=A0A7X0VWC3_9BACL|nr:glycosyltransferase [Cohnella zeiphila]MBB6733059.1 glycosyltransferase [Cohnella zeiphila]
MSDGSNGRKILFLITSLDYAGAEMQTVQLASGLRRRGWNVKIVSMTRPVALEDEVAGAGIELHSLEMSKGVPDPRAIAKLKRLIESFRPDVVHSHMVHANLLARVTRLFAPVPAMISTAHTANEGGKLRMLLYRLTDPLCELTTSVSREGVDRYIRQKASPKHKIVLMPNGISLKGFGRNPSEGGRLRAELGIGDAFVWLAVGRFVEAKDYPNLIRAWAQVLRVNAGGVLLIVGDGGEREATMRLADSIGVGAQVRFLGIRRDIPRLMGACDAFVLSSRYEGMPMVLLEASASGLPIVATDVGGNREVVRDGISGFLSGPGDPDLLARKMLSMMVLKPEERAEMGERGRQFAMAHYEMDAIVSKWESLYGKYGQHGKQVRYGKRARPEDRLVAEEGR